MHWPYPHWTAWNRCVFIVTARHVTLTAIFTTRQDGVGSLHTGPPSHREENSRLPR
jgi:hypothetical protein